MTLSKNLRNTSNHLYKEEPPIIASPPDPPNKAFLKDMREKWSNGVRHFSKADWSPKIRFL
jgi:hypothetical protein